MRTLFLAALALTVSISISRPAEAGQFPYPSLGDPVGMGEADFPPHPSLGDRGYLSLAANSAGEQARTLAKGDGGLPIELMMLLPDAPIALLGQDSPFPAEPSSPLAGVIQGLAATHIDTDSPFLGHEADDAEIVAMPGNFRPDAPGHPAIAGPLASAAAVPEPASAALLGAGLIALAALARARRRTA